MPDQEIAELYRDAGVTVGNPVEEAPVPPDDGFETVVATEEDGDVIKPERLASTEVVGDDVADQFDHLIKRAVGTRAAVSTPIRHSGQSHHVRRDVWWRSPVATPLGDNGQPVRASLDDVIGSAVRNSFQIAAFGKIPAIRETAIDEANGRFVPEAYAELKRERVNNPANSAAQARGADQAIRDEDAYEVGVRSRLITGAEVSFSHRDAEIDTNLVDFDPSEQGRKKTVVSVLQPLLREGGINYNRSIIRVAELDSEVAVHEFVRQAESHLLEVVRGYWTIYRARSLYAQQLRLRDAARRIVSMLEGRSGFDADPVQISRARAALSRRQSDLIRARSAIRNAEYRLRGLTNDAELIRRQFGEFVPSDHPDMAYRHVTSGSLIEAALQARPELRQAVTQYRAALVREGMAENEALLQLDLILEGIIHSSDGVEPAFTDDEDPHGYTAGLRFSAPLGFDERKARHLRRKRETVQQEYQVRTAIESVAVELDVSVNEYNVAFAELSERRNALDAAQRDVQAIQARWESGRAGVSGVQLISELLDAQERLQQAESDFVGAEVAFAVSDENLKRAWGGYLASHGLTVVPTVGTVGRRIYKLQYQYE